MIHPSFIDGVDLGFIRMCAIFRIDYLSQAVYLLARRVQYTTWIRRKL